MRETRRSGHDVQIRASEPGEESAETDEETPEVHTFYAVPPPIMLPTKRLHAIRGPAGRDVTMGQEQRPRGRRG